MFDWVFATLAPNYHFFLNVTEMLCAWLVLITRSNIVQDGAGYDTFSLDLCTYVQKLINFQSQHATNISTLKVTSATNYNFSNCVIWGTDYKLFYFVEKLLPFSRYSSFCIVNHPMIYRICDATLSIST